ncbi:hypothetical protein AAVH_20194 [Aphelenchoides avenae]|nr:hypothetical protein AAVH_20194 [Aphelenchus avenae]
MAFVAQRFDRGGNDDRKNNRDDGDDSESDSSSDDEEKPQKKKVMFVRCKKCIDKKNMCAECKKRRNCEASERYRLKTKLTRKALKRMKKKNCVLNAKNNEFIRQLISSGAIFCHSCSGKLADLPAAHVAPQPPPHAAVQQLDVAPHLPPHAAVKQQPLAVVQQQWDVAPSHAIVEQLWDVAPPPPAIAEQQWDVPPQSTSHAVVQQQQWDVAPPPPPHAVGHQHWDVGPQPPPHAVVQQQRDVAPQSPSHAVVQQQWHVAPPPPAIMEQQWDVPPQSPPHAVLQQQHWDVAPQPPPHAVLQQQQWDVAPLHAVVQRQWDVAPPPQQPPNALQNNAARQQHQVDIQMPAEQQFEDQMQAEGAHFVDPDNIEFAQNYEDHGNY